MKAHAKILAALVLVLAPLATAPFDAAWAQPFRREERREERREARPEARRALPALSPPRYRAPAYAGPAPAPYYAAPPRVYPPQAYAPAPYAPRPGYAPNSLGAGWGQQQDLARRGVREGGLMPLGQVTARLRQTTRGTMLDAGLEPGPDGRPAYRVRWAAAGGRRIDFVVDAATGQIISRTGY